MKKMKLLKTEGESFSTLSREQLKSVFSKATISGMPFKQREFRRLVFD